MSIEAKKEPKKPKPTPVQIRPHQVPHFRKIMGILTHEYGYVDVSPFGAGKTHVTFAVAATFKLNMIVVCPKSTIGNWKKWARTYGVNLICIMTYQSLRGQSEEVNHTLLENIKGQYYATETFSKCVQSGLLLVFDEYHNLKNDNTQLASAHAMVKELVRQVRMGAKARIALLSGTPCVKKESVLSTFKMLGIVLSDDPYEYDRSAKIYKLTGVQEAIAKCQQYDPDETLAISCRSVNKNTVKTICFDLYTKVLKRFLVSAMPKPQVDAEKIGLNYYIQMPTKDVERLKKGLLMFKCATNYRHEIQEVDYSNINWGDVGRSRMEIDSAKMPSVCRLAAEQLDRDPNCKVLIYCRHNRDKGVAMALLAKYNPLTMNAKTTEDERDAIGAKFQEDNNNCRVIISSAKVGGIGIDLDDKTGNHHRFMYILPSYFYTDQYQATGRIHREGTMSNATIYFVYSRAFPYETGILNSMAIKSGVLKEMIMDPDAKLPGEYGELLEPSAEELAQGIDPNTMGEATK